MTSAARSRARVALAWAIGLIGTGPLLFAQRPAAPQRYVAIGCLSVAAPSGGARSATPVFIVRDTRADPPAVFRLDGNADELKKHVGHTVEVAGPLSPGSKTAKTPHADAPLMKVQSLVWIASSCKPS